MEKEKDTEVFEERMRLLYSISSQATLKIEDKLNRALKLTTELMDMEIGIISRIEEENYYVEHFYPGDADLEVGQIFPLGNTYCSITLEADKAVAIDHMQRSEFERHPCYKAFQLESYIGVPVEVNNELYGTLNFSSSKPKKIGFAKADKDYMRLLGEWVSDAIEQDHIEKKLRRSEERYELAVQGSSAGIWDWMNINEKKEWWSPKFYQLLGYNDGEIDANLDTFEGLLHPGDKEKTYKALDRHFAGKEPFSVEYRLKTKSGAYKWFLGSGQAKFNKQGEPVRMVGSIVDIDDRKRAVLELANERKLLRTIIDNLPVNVYVKDREGKKVLANRSEYEFLGTENEESVLGKTDYNFNTEEIASISAAEDRKVIESGEPMLNEDTYTIVDGEKYWFLVSKLPLEDENGDIVGLVGISTDITESKQMELLLNDTQEMASVGGWEYDLASGKLLWTDEVYRIHELPVGKDVNVEEGINFYAPEARPVIEEAISNAVETGEEWDVELPFITAKGNEKWVRAIGKAHFKDGEAYKLSGTFQDLTRRKEMEDQILEQHEQLKRLNDTTNKIYSVIGHDLRGPINTIVGFSELLVVNAQNDDEDESLVDNLKLIHQSTLNVSRLLDNLLSWSRIQTGDLSLFVKEFSVEEEIKKSVELLSPTAQRKGIKICYEGTALTEVRGDERMIGTIVRNLLSNAIKFCSDGDAIEVILQQEKGWWSVAVKDEGVGMSEEVMQNLFDSDSHPTDYGTANEKGTGIGLMLCKRLAEMHGGRIEVESRLGEGSTFTLRIPFEVEEYVV